MSDLISREALMRRIQSEGKHQASQYANRYDPIVLAYGDCYAMAKTAPAVDAVEVRHGYWIGPGEYVTTAYGHLDIYQCSECGANITIDDHDSFCPACGCRMDGRGESEET